MENTKDEKTVSRIHLMITAVIALIEDATGELSQEQRDSIGSVVFGFWSALEDKRHPRADGLLWKDIVGNTAEL